VDVHLEQLAHAALEVECQGFAALVPQPVRDAVRLQRLETLVVEEGLQIALAGGVALETPP
jgi:hypothetical protein